MQRLLVLVFFVFLVGGCAEVPKETVSLPSPAKRPLVIEPKKEETPIVLSIPRVPVAKKWKYIVVHHSASPSGSADAFDYFHRVKRGWEGEIGRASCRGRGEIS